MKLGAYISIVGYVDGRAYEVQGGTLSESLPAESTLSPGEALLQRLILVC